jgi:hypothetical protein
MLVEPSAAVAVGHMVGIVILERYFGHRLPHGVGVGGLGVRVAVDVAVGRGVRVAVGVPVGTGVLLEVGVAEGVRVRVGEAVRVGLMVGEAVGGSPETMKRPITFRSCPTNSCTWYSPGSHISGDGDH